MTSVPPNSAVGTLSSPTISITIGSGSSAARLTFPALPAFNDRSTIKAVALKNIFGSIAPHVPRFSLPEISAPLRFSCNLPTQVPEMAALAIGPLIACALLDPSKATMTALTFINADFQPVQAFAAKSQRFAHTAPVLHYVLVSSTLDTSIVDDRIPADIATITVQFY
jgi:hypothetical protein